ncbi:MAG: TonB family protein [Sulfurimonas sp.]|jgi:protein TonB|nr:TonB family protein [Sulfurimonas sp.]
MIQLANFENAKQRYISSFLLSSLFYFLLLGMLYFSLLNTEEPFKAQKEEASRISLSMMIYQEPKPLPKQKVQKKPIVEKKQTPKPVAKKALPLPPQKIEKVQEQKPVLEQEPIKEEMQTQEKLQEETQALERRKQKEAELLLVAKQEREAKQNLFVQELRDRINKNKSYPMTARRRGIEGSIEMQFYLLENGHVKDIRYLSGKTLFENSAIEAIQKSFPMDVDNKLFTFPKEFKIKLVYDII